MSRELLLEVDGTGDKSLEFFLLRERDEVLQNVRAVVSSRLGSIPESFISEKYITLENGDDLVVMVDEVLEKFCARYPEGLKHEKALSFSKEVKESLLTFLK